MTAPDRFERPVFARTRKLCLGFPEVTETTAWGHPIFRAGRKTFCAFEMIRGRPSVAFRIAPTDMRRAVRGRRCFASPYGRGRWISVWVDDAVDWTTIESMLDRSYRLVATKRQLCVLDARC
jgi:predicted DNA-binding protein (MmcQ/YjbR family)